MSLLGLGVEVTIFGIVVSFCQFLTTVLTKNGDFLCEKKKPNKKYVALTKGKKESIFFLFFFFLLKNCSNVEETKKGTKKVKAKVKEKTGWGIVG